mgnify:CR=1 FL=1
MRNPWKWDSLLVACAVAVFTACSDTPVQPDGGDMAVQAARGGMKASPGGGGGGGGKPVAEGAGNNLSFPVLWAEGVQKTLRGTPGMEPLLDGVWWYWWGMEGVDPNTTVINSCPPDPDDQAFCDDGLPVTYGDPPGDGYYKSYIQKDDYNVWQAENAAPSGPVHVDWIDWGDNLESVAWYTRSQVRTEVVLIKDLATPMYAYEMLHTDGWGIDEVHGLAELDGVVQQYASDQATVYSTCARLTIQRRLITRDDPLIETLEWVPGQGWSGTGLINAPIFNLPVYEGGDGPGYYSAEINVKGKVIYGYTWNVRNLNEGAGDYRVTFSFDETCGMASLNTAFIEGVTEILQPLEEEGEETLTLASDEGGDGGSTSGGVGVIDFGKNLTYIDVRILERGGGGGPR